MQIIGFLNAAHEINASKSVRQSIRQTEREVAYIEGRLRRVGYVETAPNSFARGRDNTVWLDFSDTFSPSSVTIRMSGQGHSGTKPFSLQQYMDKDPKAQPLADRIGWHTGPVARGLEKIKDHFPFHWH